MKGVVVVDDRSAVHVIPRSEVRHVEVVALGGDDWALKYQLAGTFMIRSIEWKGESRPLSLKTKIEVGEYNRITAVSILTIITRGYSDIHLARRADNVFLVRSGLVENDARVVMCRQFVAERAMTALLQLVWGPLDAQLQQALREIQDAAHDLVLPDGYPLQEESR